MRSLAKSWSKSPDAAKVQVRISLHDLQELGPRQHPISIHVQASLAVNHGWEWKMPSWFIQQSGHPENEGFVHLKSGTWVPPHIHRWFAVHQSWVHILMNFVRCKLVSSNAHFMMGSIGCKVWRNSCSSQVGYGNGLQSVAQKKAWGRGE